MIDVRTDTSQGDVEGLVEDLATAASRVSETRAAVESVGRADLRALADALAEADRLLNRYESSATGTGNFEAFVQFQGAVEEFVDELDADLPHRDAFEALSDAVDKRRLSAADFEKARETLQPARELAARLDDLEEARSDYRAARHAVKQRLSALDDRIAELERLAELGQADLDAPIDSIRDPITDYNDRVQNSFEQFRRDASAREVLRFVEETGRYPLVAFRQPPSDLRTYVEEYDAGNEPIPTLLKYADYSRSKLDHYVEDPGALRTRVATHRTYLTRLDAEPLLVEWPPPPAQTLRFRARELVSVVGRFADDQTVALIRSVRDLADREDYRRLRRAGEAAAELTDDQRSRLESGAVAAELRAATDERDRLRAALEEYEIG